MSDSDTPKPGAGRKMASRALGLCRVETEDVVPGMWIAEVDRPWLDTPFPLQGFLLSDQAELCQLRTCCRYVWVDRSRSTPQAAGMLPEPASAPRDLAPRAPDPRPTAEPASDRRGWLGQVRDWFQPRAVTAAASAPAKRPSDPLWRAAPPAGPILRALLPGITPVVWPQRKTVEQTLPRARLVFSQSTEVLRRVLMDIQAGSLHDHAELARAVDDMVDCMVDNADALLWVARLRDQAPDQYVHGVNVAVYLIALGRHLGLPKPQLTQLSTIGMVADIGMMKVPQEIIRKPGMLSPDQFDIVKQHVQWSIDALGESDVLSPEVKEGIVQHHERLDGTGYPFGLDGTHIGFWGRAAAIADCYAALVRPRPYAQALAPQDALFSLYQHGSQGLHGPLVEQFVHAVGAFPVGSLVELSNGAVAAVLSHNRVRRLEPTVLVLTDERKKPLAQAVQRNLLQSRVPEDRRVRITRGLPTGAYGLQLQDYYVTGLPAAHTASVLTITG